MNIFDDAEADINWKHLNHVQQHVQFSPIKILWKFRKLKLNDLESVLMNFCENFATAATCQYLLLIVFTDLFNNLKRLLLRLTFSPFSPL